MKFTLVPEYKFEKFDDVTAEFLLSLGIKGVLNVDKDSNSVIIEIEDGEALELASLLDDFNGSEVSISVGESIDIA